MTYNPYLMAGAAGLTAGRYLGKWLSRKKPMLKSNGAGANQTVINLQKQINKLKKGQTGKEWKSHDTNITDTVTTTVAMKLLTGIAQGTTSLSREGLKIQIQSLKVRGFFTFSASVSQVVLRVIIFYDMQQHGTVPAVTDVLESSSVYALKEHDKQDRFIFLKDDIIIHNPAYSGSATIIPFSYYKTLKGRKAYYIGTTGAQASQGKGNLYMLLLSDQATYGPVCNLNTRVRFTD